MKSKVLELLEIKIWLIRYEVTNEYCSPERIIKLKAKNMKLLKLYAKIKKTNA